jgi:hypothetical protein
MTILEDMYDLCDSCNVETEKAELEDGVCRGCRANLYWFTGIDIRAEPIPYLTPPLIGNDRSGVA